MSLRPRKPDQVGCLIPEPCGDPETSREAWNASTVTPLSSPASRAATVATPHMLQDAGIHRRAMSPGMQLFSGVSLCSSARKGTRPTRLRVSDLHGNGDTHGHVLLHGERTRQCQDSHVGSFPRPTPHFQAGFSLLETPAEPRERLPGPAESLERLRAPVPEAGSPAPPAPRTVPPTSPPTAPFLGFAGPTHKEDTGPWALWFPAS